MVKLKFEATPATPTVAGAPMLTVVAGGVVGAGGVVVAGVPLPPPLQAARARRHTDAVRCAALRDVSMRLPVFLSGAWKLPSLHTNKEGWKLTGPAIVPQVSWWKYRLPVVFTVGNAVLQNGMANCQYGSDVRVEVAKGRSSIALAARHGSRSTRPTWA